MKKDKNYKLRILILNPIVLIIYGIVCYYLYSLFQYGGLRRKVPFILTGTIILIIWFIFCIYKYYKKEKLYESSKKFRIWYYLTIIIIISTTLITGANIYKSAISFNGKLSWFIHDLKNKKKIELVHNNIYDYGVEGIFKDIEEEITLPGELYLSEEFQLKFDNKGEINYIYTYLYGKDSEGETQSFLISYDRNKSEDIILHLNGYVDEDYDEDMKIEPLMDILDWISLEETVNDWNEEQYGILYRGVRSWGYNTGGIVYIDKDGKTKELEEPEEEIIGYTLSVYVPGKEDRILPVRYIHDEIKVEPIEDAKSQQWDIGYNCKDGEETYFLDEDLGYQLSVVDAALGSRFYALLKSKNGGGRWENINPNPFLDSTGVSSGITFINEELGFIGLSHNGGSYAKLYRTEDGGTSFEEVSIPEIEVPLNEAESYNPFDFPEMPYLEDGRLFMLVGQGQDGDYKGGVKAMYESKDNGKTWEYMKEVK